MVENQLEESSAVPAAEEQKPRGIPWWGYVLCCPVFCGYGCYLVCPPVPELIVRKLAFQPPKKGLTYTIKWADDPERKIKNVDEVCGKGKETIVSLNWPKKDCILDDSMQKDVTFIAVPDLDHNHHIACFMRKSSEECADKNQVIIFAQPNSSDLGACCRPHTFNLVRMSEAFKCDVYAFDYSGYGYSSESPSEKNIYANIEAMYKFVSDTHPDQKIVLMGYSLGTAVMTHMASKQPDQLAGVILIAPFTSAIKIWVKEPNLDNSLCLDRFKTYEKVQEVNVPVLLIHGNDDKMISVQHSIRLHSLLKYPVPPLYLDGHDHKTILGIKAIETIKRIQSFLANEICLDNVSTSTVKRTT